MSQAQPQHDGAFPGRRPALGGALRLLYPGLGIKRWLAIGGAGIFIMALGVTYLIRYFDLTSRLPITGSVSIYALIVGAGLLLIILGLWGLFHSLLPILTTSSRAGGIAYAIYSRHQLERGPHVVAIGGGTGLSTLLRGLKEHTSNLTAVVTVADDGGSSGRLRRKLGVLPPGDIRNCLVALSDAEPVLTRLFQYRFSQGSGLEGHSFGNLFIVAMSGITGGFEEAIHQSSHVLAVRGEIVPATLANVTLSARMEDEVVVHGESNISHQGSHISQLTIDPPDALAYPGAVQDILEAQLIVLGPGSLYTSILPNLLVPGIRDAIRASRALKVYVCNVATQAGETEDYTADDHLEALLRHTNDGMIDVVLVNNNIAPTLASDFPASPVTSQRNAIHGIPVVAGDVVNDSNRLHHDPAKLAQLLFGLYHQGWRRGNGPV